MSSDVRPPAVVVEEDPHSYMNVKKVQFRTSVTVVEEGGLEPGDTSRGPPQRASDTRDPDGYTTIPERPDPAPYLSLGEKRVDDGVYDAWQRPAQPPQSPHQQRDDDQRRSLRLPGGSPGITSPPREAVPVLRSASSPVLIRAPAPPGAPLSPQSPMRASNTSLSPHSPLRASSTSLRAEATSPEPGRIKFPGTNNQRPELRASPQPQRRQSNSSATELSRFPWFHGSISREEAEKRLRSARAFDGLYLVRCTSAGAHVLAISMMYQNKIFHYTVEILPTGQVYHTTLDLKEPTMEKMIQHLSTVDKAPIRLTTPIPAPR